MQAVTYKVCHKQTSQPYKLLSTFKIFFTTVSIPATRSLSWHDKIGLESTASSTLPSTANQQTYQKPTFFSSVYIHTITNLEETIMHSNQKKYFHPDMCFFIGWYSEQ